MDTDQFVVHLRLGGLVEMQQPPVLPGAVAYGDCAFDQRSTGRETVRTLLALLTRTSQMPVARSAVGKVRRAG